MISINSIAVLIFASLIIQNEACTRALRRMNGMRDPRPSAPQRGPSVLQTPPTSQISPAAPAAPTTKTADFPDDVNYNILSGSNPSRRRQDAITAENLSPLDFASTRDWIPDDPQDEPKSTGRPLSSILNSRRFNSASQPPSSRRDNPADSFYDMAASDETDPGNSETRSVTSALPDLMSSGLSSLAPSLANIASRVPDLSQVTPSLRDTTSSLSKMTPDVSGMTSSLSNIPNQVTSGLSSLSPTNLMPSSSLFSIPGLMFLASSLASAFSSWNAENDTAASARSANTANSPYNLLSYLPSIMSAATTLTPLLSSFGATSSTSSNPNRSPLSTLGNPLSFLPTSLFGNPSDGGNVRPDRYEMDHEKSRNRPKRRGNRYNNDNTYDPDYDKMNDYSDERADDNNVGPQGYQYKYDYSSSPNGRGGVNARTQSTSKRDDRNRFQYQYQYNQPQ